MIEMRAGWKWEDLERFVIDSIALSIALLSFLQAARASEPEALKLLISLEQPQVTAPFPLRVTIHLHNSGSQPLWLYRHARDPAAVGLTAAQRLEMEEGQASYASGGSTFKARLEPLDAHDVAAPAQAHTLESVGMAHPTLVRLAPGGDYEERAVVQVDAAESAGGNSKPLWGRYRLTAVYGASFSSAAEVERNLGVELWQGEVTSNAVEVELRPPAGQGSVSGTTIGADSRPVSSALVSLSDSNEHLIEQARSDPDGKFQFNNLPPGLYWATARRAGSDVDTVVFRHVELETPSSAGSVNLPFLPQEIYEPKQMLHKPVLLRVVDNAGRPADHVSLEITWSSGTVLDSVKAETSDDGTAAVELLPGRNYLTLRRRGCPKDDQWIDVAQGGGVDDAKLTLDCSRK